jgi:hypothetical protein
VRIHGAGLWAGRPYLVLEYVEGPTLRDAWTAFDGPRLATIVDQVAQGLEAIHASEVVHRDLSPDNILIDAKGRAKVLDFGIARSLDSQLTSSQTKMQLGRLGYVAPEQARNPRDASWASDQWSLAAIVHEALTGAVPYRVESEDTSDESTMVKLADNLQKGTSVTTLTRANRSVTSALDAVVLRALRPSPGDRFPTIAIFAHALRRTMAPGVRLAVADAVASPPSKRAGSGRSRRRLVTAMGIAATLGGLLGGAVAIATWASPTPAAAVTEIADAVQAPLAEPMVSPLPPDSTPRQASLTVQSEPPGAVLILGEERITLPVTLVRPLGETVEGIVEMGGHVTTVAKLTFTSTQAAQVIPLEKIEPTPPRRRRRSSRARASTPEASEFRRREITIEPIEPLDEEPPFEDRIR